MAKTVHFVSNKFTFEAELIKLDREKVYGYTEEKYYDLNNQLCKSAYLLEDGKTVVPAGGFAMKMVHNNKEISRKELIAVDSDLNPLTQIPSVFDKDVILKEDYTMEDYLSLNITSVYQLEIASGKRELIDYLSAGNFLGFEFNYRAGYDTNSAFLIAASGEVFAVIGTLVDFEYLSLQQIPTIEEVEVAEEEDELDFGML